LNEVKPSNVVETTETEEDDSGELSDLTSDQGTNVFEAAFGYVENQTVVKSKEDDQVDVELKKNFAEFMRKKRKELYAAHREELKKEVMTAEKHYEEINLFGQAAENLEETKDGPSENKDTDDFQNFVDLLSRSELEEILRLLIPIIKLRTNLYLVGTKQR